MKREKETEKEERKTDQKYKINCKNRYGGWKKERAKLDEIQDE